MAVLEQDLMLRRELEGRLHALCQPLTVLLGRLELVKITGPREELVDALTVAREETLRIVICVREMRTLLERAEG